MLSQADYALYTGKTPNFSDEDWNKLVNLAAGRLAGLLCLDALPAPVPDDLQMLLANYICLMLAGRGDKSSVTSKKVRNFTINYSADNTSALAKLKQKYGDIFAKYSACGSGFAVEKSTSCDDGCF